MAQPPQCLAAEPHSFFAVRPGLRDPPRDPNVFSRRSAARARSDLQLGAGCSRARADDCAIRHRPDAPRMGARLPLRHRAARPRGDADGRRLMPGATPSQTIGPYWHLLHDPELADLTRFGAAGEKIVFTGTLTDGDNATVADAAVEIWQADQPASDTFQGF